MNRDPLQVRCWLSNPDDWRGLQAADLKGKGSPQREPPPPLLHQLLRAWRHCFMLALNPRDVPLLLKVRLLASLRPSLFAVHKISKKNQADPPLDKWSENSIFCWRNCVTCYCVTSRRHLHFKRSPDAISHYYFICFLYSHTLHCCSLFWRQIMAVISLTAGSLIWPGGCAKQWYYMPG